MNGWRTMESAPLKWCEVLLRIVNDDGDVSMSVGYRFDDGGWWCNGSPVDGQVTHWQPLPSTEVE